MCLLLICSDVLNALHRELNCTVQCAWIHSNLLPEQKTLCRSALDTRHCSAMHTVRRQKAEHCFSASVLQQTVQCSRLPPPAIDPPSKPKFLLLTLATTEELWEEQIKPIWRRKTMFYGSWLFSCSRKYGLLLKSKLDSLTTMTLSGGFQDKNQFNLNWNRPNVDKKIGDITRQQ